MIKKEKYKYKNYGHFDNKIAPLKVKRLVENPEWIKKHGFYPLVHLELSFDKFSCDKGEGIRKLKTRNIYYSSHIDRYIYQHYSYMLNEKYNNIAAEKSINTCCIAYRNNLGKNNIHFAKEVFDYILKSKTSYILVGDFKNFFDNLDHKYLKLMLKNVLNTYDLPLDWYKIYKSVSNFHFVELDDISRYKYGKVRRFKTKREKFFENMRDFDKFKNNFLIYNNPNNKGIPQGLPISAVLSNVYMIEADERLQNIAINNNGLYRRYSDDFIFIIQSTDKLIVKEVFNDVINILDGIPELDLQLDKTGFYKYENSKIYSVNELFSNKKNGSNRLDYLGFILNENGVSIRDKTISKYYYKLIRYVKKSNNKNSKFTLRKLFVKFSSDGSTIKNNNNKGNFITYVRKSNKIFSKKVDNKLIRNHKANIIKTYNKKKEKHISEFTGYNGK